MKRVGIGEAEFPAPGNVANAATHVLELAIIAASYVGLTQIELTLPSANPAGTPLWPPTGLALALFLLRGYGIWPAILLGSFSANITAGHSFFACGFLGIGTLAAALAGASLLNRWSNGRKTFETPRGVGMFALISVLPSLIGSSIAMGGMILANDASVVTAVTWATLWLSDVASILLITPVVVLWVNTPLRPHFGLLEAVAIFILTAVIGIILLVPCSAAT